MKPFFLSILLVVPAFAVTDYRSQFDEQLHQGDLNRMEATLRDWETSCPNEVEMLEAYATYYYNRAKKEYRPSSTRLTTREDIALAGAPETPPPLMQFDPKTILKAEDYWKKAVRLYPWRLDACFGLVSLYQNMGNFEAQYQILAETFQYVDKNRKKLRWNNGDPLPDRPSKFIPQAMEEYENFYFGFQQLEEEEKAFRLAKLIITFFPNHPSAYNSMAAYYGFKNDWEHALKYLIIANQKDPKNSLVLSNIGNTLVRLDKRKEARIYYRQVVKLNRDPEYVAVAKERLTELSGE